MSNDVHCCINSIVIQSPLSLDLNVAGPPLSKDLHYHSASTVAGSTLSQHLHCQSIFIVTYSPTLLLINLEA